MSYRDFNGKRYWKATLMTQQHTKEQASRIAKEYREMDYLARVTAPFTGARVGYVVWTRRKGKYALD